MTDKFTHLHLHTEYSLLDGLSNITDLMVHVKENNMNSLAITDHGAMYGVIDFYKAAKKEGVKPIIGMEAYTTDVPLTERPERGKFKNYHLVLLAKDEEGYRNLMKLTSIAHLDGYYYRPRIDRETLAKYSKGLICTSACAQGEIAQAFIEEDYKKAKGIAKWFADVFGKDYYLELQRHRYKEFVSSLESDELKREVSKMADYEKLTNEGILKLSRDLGIPLVATNDAHYIKKEDATAQDTLVCIATGKNVSETKRLRFIDTPTYFVTSPEEMQSLFKDLPDAIENTVKIAEKCNLEISTLGKWFFPDLELTKGQDDGEFLKKLVMERLPQKVQKVTKEVKERVNQELEIIIKKGFAPYFLVMMDIVNWANERGIVTNTRGSAAGSLVSYALGITTVNPLTYYLPFERFLNPFRPLPPDIDLDVADDRREEMLTYISEKYGKDKVAQICTFGRMLSRAAVRDVARVLGYDYATGDRISKLIPPPKQGFPVDIPRALRDSQDLRELYEADKDTRRILDLAKQLEGNARHLSVHAAAVVISPTSLEEFTPLQREPSGDKIITQYEMHACEDVGLIKYDILGIRNLSILGDSVELVKTIRGIDIDIQKIPIDDKKTFEMLGRGETMGTFQLSGSGMTRYLKDLKPERVEDLMAMVALYRPGPMQVIPEYIKRKRNPKLVKYPDPRMKKFLESSYGLLVYQDDLLFSALEIAGYSWEETDKFRKAVGKKIPSEMAAQKAKFIEGVVKNGQSEGFAKDLWDLFEPFQAYGFNKAHAASYGIVAYQTAYMKANYPVEYMTALLTAESGDNDKIAEAITECRRMGIKVLPPDINQSLKNFTIIEAKDSLDGKAIRFGLDAVKNVGSAAIIAIFSARESGPFVSFADFLARVDSRKVNKKVVESLIKVGALESFGKRAYLLSSLDEVRGRVSKPTGGSGQQGLFMGEGVGKIKVETSSYIQETVSEFSEEELQKLERQLLGFSLSAKPVQELMIPFLHKVTHKISELTLDAGSPEMITIAGVVKEVRTVTTKRTGQEMAFVKIEDGTGSVNLVVFPSTFKETRSAWVDNNAVLVMGKLDSRDEELSILVNSIQTKDALEESATKSEVVSITIPEGVGKHELARLRDLLLKNPGAKSVTLVFEKQKSKKLNLPYKISWNKVLATKISEILSDTSLS